MALANARGGQDDITVLVIRAQELPASVLFGLTNLEANLRA